MAARLHALRSRPARLRRRLGMGLEQLELRQLLATLPFGAASTDTAEYMLGDVHVEVVFLESADNGSTAENWTASQISQTITKVQNSLQWWEDTLHAYYPEAYLDFKVDLTHANTPFVVPFEPINRTSYQHTDFVNLFLNAQGFTSGDIDSRIREFNHAQRVEHGTDWAFTIFVVNDAKDPDDQWLPGGLTGAFAYYGGRYYVSLASRATFIFAHETAHLFYGLDEYSGGDSYNIKRGYYNEQNLNGSTGAPQGFQQQASIMSGGSYLTDSYTAHTLPEPTRAHIGWRDTDGDGLLDVIDVEHSLTGTGFVDPTTSNYRFVGQSQVRTLPNLNTLGNKNDITINRISSAEYSYDGVTWQTAATYDNLHSADLDLTIPIAGNAQIFIRTRDARTGVLSEVFTAPTSGFTSMAVAGINGFVFNDANSNGVWDNNESPVAQRTLRLVDQTGQPLAGPIVLDANSAPAQNYYQILPGVRLTVAGSYPSTQVFGRTVTYGSTTSKVYSSNDVFTTEWNLSKQLKIEFTTPVKQLSIDAMGTFGTANYGRLDIYDATNKLIGRYTTGKLAAGQLETMTLGSDVEIAYALAYGHAGSAVALNRLTVGAGVTATTNEFGAYAFPFLPAGTYYVQAILPEDWRGTTPANSTQSVVLSGVSIADIEFGQRVVQTQWQNNTYRFDVNGDTYLSPLDALIVIVHLNATGSRELTERPSGEGPPAFIDVNGDGFSTPLDALEVIIQLNSGAGNPQPPLAGSGESGGTGATGGSQGENPAVFAPVTSTQAEFAAPAEEPAADATPAATPAATSWLEVQQADRPVGPQPLPAQAMASAELVWAAFGESWETETSWQPDAGLLGPAWPLARRHSGRTARR